jgi:hypothetical protein
MVRGMGWKLLTVKNRGLSLTLPPWQPHDKHEDHQPRYCETNQDDMFQLHVPGKTGTAVDPA